jgi:autotransporter-associated beta strand protein
LSVTRKSLQTGLLLLLLIGVGACMHEATASTNIAWTGAAGDGLWSTPGNWSPNGAPVTTTTYDMTFPAYGQSNNNIGTIKINTLVFTGAGNNIISTTGGSLAFSPPGGGGGVSINAGVTGTDTISIPVSINANFPISVNSATATLVFAGQISGNKQNSISGTGTVVLAASNTYKQGTQINSGVTVILAADQALGDVAAGTTISSGATLGFQGGLTYTVLEPITLGSGGAATLTNFAGNNSFSGAITMASADTINLVAGTLTLNGTLNNGGFTPTITGAGNLTDTGVISGLGGLTMSGSGTTTLTNTETYSGATTVNAGTLLVNGTLNLLSSTTVNSGGTLGGTGTVRAVTMNNGGFIEPGVNGSGTLNSGNVTLGAGASFSADVATAGSNQLNVAGLISLGGSTLDLTVNSAPNPGAFFTIINNDLVDPVLGTFAGLPEGSLIVSNGYGFQITYVGGTGNDVVLKYVPCVASITCTNANPTNAPQVSFTVTFSEPVKGVDAADFALVVTGGLAGTNIASVTPSSGLNTVYTVTVNTGTISANGTIQLNLVDNDTITDSANIKLGGPGTPPPAGGPGDDSFTGSTYTVHYFVATAVLTQDRTVNGLLDTIKITTNLNLNDDFSGLTMTATVGAYTYALAATRYGTDATSNDNIFIINLTERSGLPQYTGDTGNLPVIALTANTTLSENGASGVLLRAFSATAVDGAAPVLMASQWNDGGGSSPGVDALDTITLYFSENVISQSAVISDIGTAVTGDSLSTSTIADQGPSAQLTITLGGTPFLSPGGTYSFPTIAAGSPSGLFINNGSHIKDVSPAQLTAANTAISSAVDLLPGTPVIACCWNDFTILPKMWNVGTVDLSQTFTANPSFPPIGLAIVNSGNVRSQLTVQCSGSAPNGWSLGAAPATNIFSMKADASSPLDGIFELDLSAGPQPLIINLYSGMWKTFDLQFQTPTQLTLGAGVQQTITVTIVITQN